MRKVAMCLVVMVALSACKLFRKTEQVRTVIIRDTVQVLVSAPIPATESTIDFFAPWESLRDSFLVEDGASFAEVVMQVDTTKKVKKYTVRHGRLADTVMVSVPVVMTDTIYIRTQTGCPPCPTQEKGFPWMIVLGLVALLLVFFVGDLKKAS